MAHHSIAVCADNLHDHFLIVQFCQLLKQHFFSNAKDSDGAYIVCCLASLRHCAKIQSLNYHLQKAEERSNY